MTALSYRGLVLFQLFMLSFQQDVDPLTAGDMSCFVLERDRSPLFNNTCFDIDYEEFNAGNVVS